MKEPGMSYDKGLLSLWTLILKKMSHRDYSKIALAGAVVLVSSALLSLPPLALKEVIDIVDQASSSHRNVYFFLGCYVMLLFLGRVFRESQIFVFGPVQQNFQKYFTEICSWSLLKKNYQFYLHGKFSTLAHTIALGENALGILLQRVYFDVLSMALEILFSFIMLLSIFKLKYAVLFASFIIIYLFSIVKGAIFVRPFSKAAIHETIKSKTMVTDLAYNFESIKIFKLENVFQDRISFQLQQQRKSFFTFFKNRTGVGILQSFILGFFFLTTNIIGIIDVYSDNVSLGFLTLINVYMLQVIKPFEEINLMIRDILVSIDSLQKCIDTVNPDVDQAPLHYDDTEVNELQFKNVNFTLDSHPRPLLHNISLTLKKGERIVVVGSNGSGKTTLSKIICGLLEPTMGSIQLNGKTVSQKYLCRLKNIILVPQDPALFNEDILYNIFLENNGSQHEIPSELSDKLELRDLLNRHKDRFPLGERGNNLSGGERQRIFLLRALLRNSDFLVLDEATSSQDIDKEKSVVQSLLKIRDKCIVFITHNWENVVFFDKVIHLKEGSIEFFGDTEEFLKSHDRSYERKRDNSF